MQEDSKSLASPISKKSNNLMQTPSFTGFCREKLSPFFISPSEYLPSHFPTDFEYFSIFTNKF